MKLKNILLISCIMAILIGCGKTEQPISYNQPSQQPIQSQPIVVQQDNSTSAMIGGAAVGYMLGSMNKQSNQNTITPTTNPPNQIINKTTIVNNYTSPKKDKPINQKPLTEQNQSKSVNIPIQKPISGVPNYNQQNSYKMPNTVNVTVKPSVTSSTKK